MSNSNFLTKLSYTIPLSLFLATGWFSIHLRGQEIATNNVEGDSLEGYAYEFAALGTRVQLKAYHAHMPTVRQAFHKAEVRVRELEAILSDYDRASETSRLSELASQQPTAVSQPLWNILVHSERWYQVSDGAFDASLGGLTRLWRKYRHKQTVPPADMIEQALETGGWNHVVLDRESQRVALSSSEVHFDFGGIGKGYIVDQAFEVLQAHGLNRCLVDISGNMRLGDSPPDRNGWRIEIAPNAAEEQLSRRIALQRTAIATSGDLWQYVEVDGIRYSHILDPTTGWGVLGPISATAVAETATDADAMATVACILPAENSLKLAAQQDIQVLIARSSRGNVETFSSKDFPLAISP